MSLIQGALVDEMLLDQRRVIQRVQVQVLVVGQDEDDVWLLSGRAFRFWAWAVVAVAVEWFLAAILGNSDTQVQTCCRQGES